MLTGDFPITIEVVPPLGPDPQPLLGTLESISHLPFQGFSVATNPVAKPRMSAKTMCALIQQRIGKPAILHCTTRDHNRLSLQALLWGARALGLETVLVATGDFVALGDRATTTTVRDVDVYALAKMAREAGLQTGVVFDFHPEINGLLTAVHRLRKKVDAGAEFAVTQPVYDAPSAERLADALASIGIPVLLGILPLRTPRHANFLHEKVSGIAVPEEVRRRMQEAPDPVAEGVDNARQMLSIARRLFKGACIMPPFDHYEVLFDILK